MARPVVRDPGDAGSAGIQPACLLRAWESHEPELRGFLERRAADPSLADDLLQEVFLKAMRQGVNFCEVENTRAWLFRVARNALVDHARRSRTTVDLPEDLAQDEGEEPAPVDRLTECLDRVLAEMPAEDAEILRRCDLEGMKQADFARAHGLGLPAAKSRLLRARARLRKSLSEACRVSFDEQGKVCCFVPRSPR